MKNTMISRQSIYDKELNVYAYKLMSHRGTNSNELLTGNNTSSLTPDVLSKIDLPQLVGEYPIIIDVEHDFVITEIDIPKLPNQLIIEFKADIEINEMVISSLKTLSNHGHIIVLNNITPNEKNIPLIEMADIIKIDVSMFDKNVIQKHVNKLRQYKVRLLAQNIETQEKYEFCMENYFDYFQGDFICKPNLATKHQIPANKVTIVYLLAQLQDPNVQIEKLEELISQDLALSFKLLKYINSAAFTMQREVDSIHHAIVMLGLNTIRSLANLMLMSNIDDKPHELLVIAIIRARMCEELAVNFDKKTKETYFTAGLFSVIDALMDSSMEDIVSQLPLSTELRDALLEQKGIVGEALKCCIAFERADWKNVKFQNLDEMTIQKSYFNAVIWSNQAMTLVVNE